MEAVTLKRNDTQPSLVATLTRKNGSVVSTAGAAVRFYMRNSARETIVDAAAVIVVESPAKVQYNWAALDTANSGLFEGEFEITYGSGLVETFPNNTYIPIIIIDDL